MDSVTFLRSQGWNGGHFSKMGICLSAKMGGIGAGKTKSDFIWGFLIRGDTVNFLLWGSIRLHRDGDTAHFAGI